MIFSNVVFLLATLILAIAVNQVKNNTIRTIITVLGITSLALYVLSWFIKF